MQKSNFRANLCDSALSLLKCSNIVQQGSSASLARRIAVAAETIRKEQAEQWLGHALPRWRHPCPIVVRVNDAQEASGRTSFVFWQGRPENWRMTVEGSEQAILESVLPHEVTHTVFATHFGRRLPRWADEGGCVMAEPKATQKRLLARLVRDIHARRILSIKRLFTCRSVSR